MDGDVLVPRNPSVGIENDTPSYALWSRSNYPSSSVSLGIRTTSRTLKQQLRNSTAFQRIVAVFEFMLY